VKKISLAVRPWDQGFGNAGANRGWNVADKKRKIYRDE